MSEPNAGQRPRRPLDPRGRRRRSASSSTGRRCGRATPWSRRSASATCAPTRDVPKHKGISRAHHRHGHARHRRPPAAPHHRRAPSSPRCSSPTSSCPRRTSSASSTTAGASRWARSRTSAAGCGSSGGDGAAGGRRPRRAGPAATASTDDPACAGAWPSAYGRSRRCGRSATRASPSFAQGCSAPEHSYMKLATSELGKALYELGMDLQGPYGAVVDPERGDEHGRWATVVLRELRQHHRRRHERDPAQHHRHPRPRTAEELRS